VETISCMPGPFILFVSSAGNGNPSWGVMSFFQAAETNEITL